MRSLRYPAIITNRLALLSEPHPARDCRLLLSIGLLALVVVIGWHVWVFQAVVQGEALGALVASTSEAPVIDRGPMQAVRALYEERASEEARYSTGAYSYSDPSQP